MPAVAPIIGMAAAEMAVAGGLVAAGSTGAMMAGLGAASLAGELLSDDEPTTIDNSGKAFDRANEVARNTREEIYSTRMPDGLNHSDSGLAPRSAINKAMEDERLINPDAQPRFRPQNLTGMTLTAQNPYASGLKLRG